MITCSRTLETKRSAKRMKLGYCFLRRYIAVDIAIVMIADAKAKGRDAETLQRRNMTIGAMIASIAGPSSISRVLPTAPRRTDGLIRSESTSTSRGKAKAYLPSMNTVSNEEMLGKTP